MAAYAAKHPEHAGIVDGCLTDPRSRTWPRRRRAASVVLEGVRVE